MRVVIKDIYAEEVGSYEMSDIPRKGETLILLDREVLIGCKACTVPRLGNPCYDVFAVVWHLGDEPFIVVHGKMVELPKEDLWPENR